MIHIEHLLWIVPFCLAAGMVFAETVGKWNRKTGDIKTVDKKAEELEFDVIPDPMMLRNGMNVTRDDKPTFAEQLVNIMKYNGENQREGDHGED